MPGTGEPLSCRVALVVLNRNGSALLADCLDAAQATSDHEVAVLVVDNGSSDGSVEMVQHRFPAVHLLPLAENRGVAGGRNAGLAWVRAQLRPEFLLFIDNDTRLEPDAVRELVRAADADPRIGLVAPKAYREPGDPTLVSAGGMRFSPYLGAAWDVAAGETDRGQHEAPCEVQACPGFAFFVRREVLERVGPFDEAFNPYGWEDVELSLRAARAGFRLVYAPAARVYHKGGRAARGPIASYERHKARKMLRLLRLHSTPLQRCCFMSLLPFRAGWRIGRELARGNHGVVTAWVSGALGRGR